jgi:hypothetical protein
MHTLICISKAPSEGVIDIELAEFLLAYNAYLSPASLVFMGPGLNYLNPKIKSRVSGPSPQQMLSALCYGENKLYGFTPEPIDFTPSVPLTWIDEPMIAHLKATHRCCLIY